MGTRRRTGTGTQRKGITCNVKDEDLIERIKKAVLEALTTLEPKTNMTPSASSNKKLMRKLLNEGASDQEIRTAFRKRYAAHGKTDKNWIDGRIKIYRQLVSPKKGGRSRAA